MESSQQTNVLCLVRENFSKATDEDGRLVWDRVKGYGFDDAREAIREHRVEKGAQAWRPDIRRIASIAAARHNGRMRDRHAARPVHKQIAQDRPDLADLDAASRVVTFFEEAWEHAKEAAAPDLAWAARAMIFAHCRRALQEANVEDADVLARATVEAGPGERLAETVSQAILNRPKAPDTSSFSALKQLAVAEHGGAAAATTA